MNVNDISRYDDKRFINGVVWAVAETLRIHRDVVTADWLLRSSGIHKSKLEKVKINDYDKETLKHFGFI